MMFTGNSFGKTMDILHRAMDVSLIRRDVIADNIANADTPNFKRSEINFETALKKALESEQVQPRLEAHMTHERHIPFHRTVDYRTVRPVKHLDYLTTAKQNGSNVDIEQEMMHSMSNQLSYQLMAQVTGAQFNLVNMVLRG